MLQSSTTRRGPSLGGLALATMVFSFLFWGFGFLRMGTTALVANALGGNASDLAIQTLIRAMTLALLIGRLCCSSNRRSLRSFGP